MLNDFVSLQAGDVVVQNAGNSGVGVMVSQLAAAQSVSVVSVVRRGSRSPQEFEELKEYLQGAENAAMIVAEEDLSDRESINAFQQALQELPGANQLPKLALNAVGGTSAKLLLKVLQPGGTMVTYGGMSGKGVEIATLQLIFKDLTVAGYWHSRWMVHHGMKEKQEMIDALAQAALEGNVECPPVRVFPLKDFREALKWQAEQSSSVIRSKLVFDCQVE